MGNIILAIFLIIIGAISFILALRFIIDNEYAQNYIKTSPKAFIWRKIFGEEKAYTITKIFFAPLGIILSSIFILLGIAFLILKIFILK